ncbi:MAG: DUF1127 domain-containing protein [Phyllobacteriaceae bacterium]|nr:DUF1127 domain-containing protein [Phyllobacteriaceae bacterium]
MALSLSSERSLAAGSHAHSTRGFTAWIARIVANRRRQAALKDMMAMDDALLRDLGVTRGDIADAMQARDGVTPGMMLHAARARSARS